jgi:mono/diheme cytochrome c family protein
MNASAWLCASLVGSAAVAAAATSCASRSTSSSVSAATGTLSGTFVAVDVATAAIPRITFFAGSPDYSLSRVCDGSAVCEESGTYALDAAHAQLTLTNGATGTATALPFTAGAGLQLQDLVASAPAGGVSIGGTAYTLGNNTDAANGGGGWYHLSEGGEIFPYFALSALRVTINGQTVPFMSAASLAQYGFLPDSASSTNPYGLPAGMTLARAPDTQLISIGFNCSACHTGSATAAGSDGAVHTVRLEGAPAHVDILGFSRGAIAAFASNVGADASIWDQTAYAARALAEAVHEAADSSGEAQLLWTRAKMLFGVLTHAGDATSGDVTALVDAFDIPQAQKELLLARYGYFKTTLASSQTGSTVDGPGRADPYGEGANNLFAQYGYHVPPDSPLRYQPLFDLGQLRTYSYTSNTTSILFRNSLQALATGASSDFAATPPVTSVIFGSLVTLEGYLNQIPAPAWPASFPAPDPTLAARGKSVYRATCAGCHDATLDASGLYDPQVLDVGTDPNLRTRYLATVNVGAPIGSGTLSTLLTPVVRQLDQGYCASASLSPTACLQLDDVYDATLNPAGRRAAPSLFATATGYQAKPPAGMWAMAPFLHNGSVPTIADLLSPASARPATFAVGHSGYDTTRLGLVTYASLDATATAAGATFLYDTSQPGNSNAGHEGAQFGTTLSADDKTALLEYLKGPSCTFGGDGGSSLICAGAGPLVH